MLPLTELFPLRSVAVTLRFLQASHPAFLHQPALGAFLRYLAGSPEGFERLIRFDARESGRIAYPPGQCYRFTLICLAGGEPIFNTLLDNLARLPGSSPRQDRPLPFRDNCALAALHDSFTAEAVTGFDELCAYDFASLQQEAERWCGCARLTWQFLSPARLLKDKARRGAAKGEARYCRNLSDLDGPLLSARLYDSLAELLRSRGVATPPRPPSPPVQNRPRAFVLAGRRLHRRRWGKPRHRRHGRAAGIGVPRATPGRVAALGNLRTIHRLGPAHRLRHGALPTASPGYRYLPK